ncbi:acyl-homoserine-lactone synthase [Enterobacter bugandensis]|uniref:acyl-homoserine-lactone synthase n=1 Tax=Enterobacter bugandensis TaxID=881260 RepID=UPI003D6FEF5B
MLKFHIVNYSKRSARINNLFKLRKVTFKDRLGWDVKCINGLECDEYDNEDATYLIGVKDNRIICSNRFIPMSKPNMIENTFSLCFDDISIPINNQIESSRFFVDKKRVSKIKNKDLICTLHFIAMMSYGIMHSYSGIYTVVSHPMLKILQRSGWNIDVIKKGKAPDKDECIYIIFMPTTELHRQPLIERIDKRIQMGDLYKWPLSFKLTTMEE